MDKPEKQSDNLSLQRRHAARMAAVQYLYQQRLAPGEGIEPYITRIGNALLEVNDAPMDDEAAAFLEKPEVTPDFAFLRKLLEGLESEVAAMRALLEKQNDQPGKRAFGRLSLIIQCILLAGTYELAHHNQLDAPIIINEYVSLAAGFYDAPECGYINGTLQEMAKGLRAAV